MENLELGEVNPVILPTSISRNKKSLDSDTRRTTYTPCPSRHQAKHCENVTGLLLSPASSMPLTSR